MRPAGPLRLVGLAVAVLMLATTGCGSSHVDDNVPTPTSFQPFLERDLRKYFDDARGLAGHRVTAELLRDGPTQSGVAYPKFYAWVTVSGGTSPDDRGAVRLAAIDKERFEITHFVSEAALRADPEAIKQVFPAEVRERIAAKVNPN